MNPTTKQQLTFGIATLRVSCSSVPFNYAIHPFICMVFDNSVRRACSRLSHISVVSNELQGCKLLPIMDSTQYKSKVVHLLPGCTPSGCMTVQIDVSFNASMMQSHIVHPGRECTTGTLTISCIQGGNALQAPLP